MSSKFYLILIEPLYFNHFITHSLTRLIYIGYNWLMDERIDHSIMEERVEWIYNNSEYTETELLPVIENIEAAVGKGNTQIDYPLLSLIFLKPQFTRQFHTALARTMTSVFNAAEAHDPNLLKEYCFFIANDPEKGLITTEVFERSPFVESPKLTDEERAKITSIRDSFCLVHTHPVLNESEPLKPSVLEESDDSLVGDLYALRLLGEDRGIRNRPLFIIMQQNMAEVVKLLFISESEETEKLDTPTYVQMLCDKKTLVDNATSQQRILDSLTQLGLNISFLEMPMEDFYFYPFMEPTDIRKIAKEINPAN